MSFLSRVFKRKKNNDEDDALQGLDELEAGEKEGLFIDGGSAPGAAAETAATAEAAATAETAAATAPLDDDDVETDEAPMREPAEAVPTADEKWPPAAAALAAAQTQTVAGPASDGPTAGAVAEAQIAAGPASDGPTAGAVAEAQIAAAEAQTAAAKAQIAAAQTPTGADSLEEGADDGGGALELDADEEESPQGEETEGDSDDDDADDALSAFRGAIKTSFASKLTKDIDDVSMEDVVKELREVRAMLPTIGGDDSAESSEE